MGRPKLISSKAEIPDDLWNQVEPMIQKRNKPLGGGRWSNRDFFNAITTKFATKRDWDDLEVFGFPPGKILFQQFIEWRGQGLFGTLSVMDLGQYKFDIKYLISDELPRHVIQKATRLRIDPETLVRPDFGAYPPDKVEEEIKTLFPWYAENRRRVDAMMGQRRKREFQNSPDLLINRARSRSR